MEKLGNIWLKYFEPSAEPMCKETREIFKDCIAKSKCYSKYEDFKRCVKEDIDPECIPLRKRYGDCKKLSVDRSKDFRSNVRYK